MTDTQILVAAVGATAGLLGVALEAGYLANHTEEIARSWQDGLEWLDARHTDLLAARETLGRLAGASGLWVLCTVLRAHGRHRAEATA